MKTQIRPFLITATRVCIYFANYKCADSDRQRDYAFSILNCWFCQELAILFASLLLIIYVDCKVLINNLSFFSRWSVQQQQCCIGQSQFSTCNLHNLLALLTYRFNALRYIFSANNNVSYVVATTKLQHCNRRIKCVREWSQVKRKNVLAIDYSRTMHFARFTKRSTLEVLLNKSCYDGEASVKVLLRTNIHDYVRLSWMTDVACQWFLSRHVRRR